MSKMDWRKKAFLAKFQAATLELGASSHHDIESLKFRDSTSYQDYRDLIRELAPLKVVEVQGEYQGKAWKLTDTDGNSIIIVEHETGLEILYIVGSVASILGLVPKVINSWKMMRNHWLPHRGRFGIDEMERRRFGKNNKLIEEPAPPLEAIMLQHLLNQHDNLSKRISSLEDEVSGLKNRIDAPSKGALKKKRTRAPKVD